MIRSQAAVACMGGTRRERRSREVRESPGRGCARAASAGRGGFTLIELLVVLAIVMILVAILGTGLRGARQAARTGVCLSNHRQIGVAMTMYAGAFRDLVPREGSVVSEAATEQGKRARLPWPVAFRPFLDDRVGYDADPDDLFAGAPYYRDPARPKDAHNVHYVVSAMPMLAPGVVDAGARTNYWRRRGLTPLSRLRYAESTLYLTEFSDDPDAVLSAQLETLPATDLYRSQLYDVWDALHIDPASPQSRLSADRHGAGGNGLFVDGHAQTLRKDRLQNVDTWDDHDYGVRIETPTPTPN
jgi:prepilin-type N-terminal cleavage/methylation domain-containing protein/prepilin-type processing-associated H-X9-DG protein